METNMRKLAVMGASALVMALGVVGASAQPTTDQVMNAGKGATFLSSAAVAMNPTIQEGRAAATIPFAEDQLPHHAR
jgi:hypothetical protein